MAAFDPDAYLNTFDPDKYLGEDNSPYGKYVKETRARAGTQRIPTFAGDVSYYPEDEPLSKEEWEKKQNKQILSRMGEQALGGLDAATSFIAKLPAQATMPFTAAYGALRGLKGKELEERISQVAQGPSWTDPKTAQGEKYLGKIGEVFQPFGLSPYANMGHIAARAGIRRGPKPTAPVVKPIAPVPEQQSITNQLSLDQVPAEIKEQQAFFNRDAPTPFDPDAYLDRGDLSKQAELPFTEGPEAIRAEQLRREGTQGDMFNELYQKQKEFDPFQEGLQKEADLGALELQKVAAGGEKQKVIDDAFVSRQRQLFEEEQRAKQDAVNVRLEDKVELPLREGRHVPKSELGAIDLQAVKEAITKYRGNAASAGDVLHSYKGAFNDDEMAKVYAAINDPKGRDTVVLMSPNQFHSLAAARTQFDLDFLSGPLRNNIREGLERPLGLREMPFLQIDKEGQVMAHEGRHRMDVFKEQGLDLIPVRLRAKDFRWGEQTPPYLHAEDTVGVSPEVKRVFAQKTPEILTRQGDQPKYMFNSQRGVLDINALGEAFKKLRVLKNDSPELAPAKQAIELDHRREAVYNSIPGLDAFRPIWDTPEKVLASLDDPKAKDLGPMQKFTAETLKPGIRTVRVANNNPIVAFRQHTAMKTTTQADALARQYITSKDGMGPIWEKFTGDEQVQVHRLLEQGSQELRRFSVEEMTEAGYTPKQIEFVEKFAAAWDAKLDIWNENLLTTGQEPVKPRPGYLPGVFKGDFWSLAMEDGKIVGFVGTDTKFGYDAVIKGLKEKTPTLTFTPMKRRGLTGSFRRSDLAQGMRDIMAVLGKNDPQIEQFRQVIQAVENEKANSWLGADLHALNKKGIWGNEGNKPWEKNSHVAARDAMKSYFAAWEEGVLSHLNLQPNAELTALAQNPEVMNKWPRALDYVNTYTNSMTGMHTSQLGTTLNNVIDMITKVVSFGQLGPRGARTGVNQFTKRMGQWTQGFGNIPYTAMQMLQPAMTAIPEMFRAGNSIDVSASTAQGFKDSLTYIRKKLGENVDITPDQAEMYTYAENVGLLTFSEFDDVSKVTQSKLARGFDTVTDFNRRAGELSTRPYVFFTMVDLLRKHETIPAGEILDTAYNLTQYSMTDYSPAERALMYQKLGVAGQLAGSLTQFKHSWVNQNVQWLKEAPKKPQMALAGLVGIAALSGYRGMAGYDDLDSMVKYITNKWGDKQVSIADIIAANGPEWLSEELPAFGAGSAYSGIDVSSRLGSAQLTPESPLEAVSPYMGKAAKILEHAGQLGTNPKAGQNLATELAPSSVRGLIEDKFSTTPEGMLQNKKGQNEYQRSEFDRSVRQFGLTSLEESKARDKVYQGTSRKQTDSERRGKITGEVVLKATQLGKDWLKSEEFNKLKNEYIKRGGNPQDLINNVVKGKMDSKLTGKQRAEGIDPSDIGSVRRYQYQNP